MPDIAATTLSLVAGLYEAIAHAEAWPPFLDSLASAVGGIVPAIFVTDAATDANLFYVSSGLDPAWGGAYEGYFKQRDPRRARIKELPANAVFIGSTLLPDRDLVRSEFYNEFLHPQGYFHIVGGIPMKREDALSLVRVIRPRTAPPFGAHDVALIRCLLPHLARALRLREQLDFAESRRDDASEVLDRLPGGVLLLDGAGRVVATNRAADQILGAGQGLRLGRDGIRAALPAEMAALQRLIARAAESPTIDESSDGVLNVTRQPPHRPLNLLVAPLRGGSLRRAARRASVVVFVTDPDRPSALSVQRVQRWLGLTPAEAALVVELLRGLRVEEAAETLHISTHTARTQLKRALVKTGTGRQAELLRLALGTPGALTR